jgi:hypothetical protein
MPTKSEKHCYHCKEIIEEGAEHDCWSTTEEALTRELSDDLSDAWKALRAWALRLGEQRIYASHHSIMFSRATCHFFARPKKKAIELCVFLPREVRSSFVKKVTQVSATKWAHTVLLTHRDDVDEPITDWLSEAYEHSAKIVRAPKAVAKKVTKKPSK